MNVVINKEQYEYYDHIVEQESIRKSFINLINSSFGFDFTKWHQEGYWTEKYEPHVLVKDGEVVATVTVNHMRYRYKEEKYYIQLGGVLARREYRKKGLMRWLMEHIIEQYQDQCDQMFLLSNDSAVNFYPKFGFEKAVEYIAEYKAISTNCIAEKKKPYIVQKLNIEKLEDRKILSECYQKSNPFSDFPSVDCEELVVFYGLGFRKDGIYYFPELGLTAIVESKKDRMILEDVYGEIVPSYKGDKTELLETIVNTILECNQKQEMRIQLGFTPKEEIEGLTVSQLTQKDDTLYLLRNKENLFQENQLRFPILSHC